MVNRKSGNYPSTDYGKFYLKHVLTLLTGMTYEARSFFQFLLNLTFLLNELNVEMLTNLKPVVSEYEVLEENNFGHNNPNEDLQGKGQLISKCSFGVIVSTKKQRKFFRISALASKKK